MNNAKNYNLNQGQKQATDEFFKFLFSEGKEFIISGRAGTGKTYLMNYIIDNTMNRYFETCKMIGVDPIYDSVFMTATTNKAAEVLSVATGRPTQTIHSFLNLRVKEDFSTGVSTLTKTNNWIVHSNKIIFIDESSMIDKNLYQMIQEGTHKCKIVYVGDHYQLAPIRETISMVYTQNSPLFELTEPMRNAGVPALIDLCEQLRETVRTGIFKPIKPITGIIDHLSDQEMQDKIKEIFKNQTKESRILSFTNKRVIQYNDFIRNFRGLPSNYNTGEILVNNTVYTKNKRTIPVETIVEVISNNGPDKVEIYKDTFMDIDKLTFKTELGDFYQNIPVPTNRVHYEDLIKYSARIKDWNTHYKLKQEYPDLRPRDAATVHKSQGSTYDSVFIDLANISTCNFVDQVARILYVAFSRAKTRVYMYGTLADKYGGLDLG